MVGRLDCELNRNKLMICVEMWRMLAGPLAGPLACQAGTMRLGVHDAFDTKPAADQTSSATVYPEPRSLSSSLILQYYQPLQAPVTATTVDLDRSFRVIRLQRTPHSRPHYGSHVPLVRPPFGSFVAQAQLTSFAGIGSAWSSSSWRPSSSSSPPSLRLSSETSPF